MYIFRFYDKNNFGGVSVNKNELTDKKHGKGSRGFYAALGISALMIGTACIFAHKQGDRLPDNKPVENNFPIVTEVPVNKRATNIPKATAPVRKTEPAAETRPVQTEAPAIPAAEAAAKAPFEVDSSFTEHSAEAAAETSVTSVHAPLADIGNILAPFSEGELVKNETTGTWQTHNGTDIAAEVGADVYATLSGEVAYVKNDPLWGVSVVLDHKNGYTTKYCGLGSDLAVQQGDTVESGSLIGAVGETADIESSVPAHLHIEMTHNGSFIDPLSLMEH